MLGWKELLIILVIVILVFGTKKLANIGKDLGSAVKGFKEGMHEDEKVPTVPPRVAHESSSPIDEHTIDVESRPKS